MCLLSGRKEAEKKKETSGSWKVSGAVSICTILHPSHHHIFLTLRLLSLILLLSIALSSPLDLAAAPATPVSVAHAHRVQSQFNHRAKMTAGAEREVRGIVQVCEVGAKRGNETERNRGGGGGQGVA